MAKYVVTQTILVKVEVLVDAENEAEAENLADTYVEVEADIATGDARIKSVIQTKILDYVATNVSAY